MIFIYDFRLICFVLYGMFVSETSHMKSESWIEDFKQ